MPRTIEFLHVAWLFRYEPRWKLLDLCFLSVEYAVVIRDYSEFSLDLDLITSILINLKHQFDDDSIILIGIKYEHYIYHLYVRCDILRESFYYYEMQEIER